MWCGMTVLARVRGFELELLVDNWVLPDIKYCLVIPKPIRMTWMAGPSDIEPLKLEVTEVFPSYYEYEVTDHGVTRYLVYLPKGAKPPREGARL